MASVRRPRRDPNLEKLRATGLIENAPPDINQMVEELIEKTRRIHAGFLFDAKYGNCETWRLLMSYLCATSDSSTGNMLADWKAFCNLLGFERPIIQSIENVQPNSEDPVTNTLRAYCQRPDATLSRVVSALKQMEREDLLLIISQSLNDLADGVLRDHEMVDTTESNDSGYISRHSQDQEEPITIIIPRYIPSVPCLLKDQTQLRNAFEKIESSKILNTSNNTSILTPITTTNLSPNTNIPFEHSSHVNSSPSESDPIPAAPRQNLNCVVMLTFATDGQGAAMELARVLRQTREDGKRCGVLILQEQLAALNQDPIAFIGGSFRKVAYVIPILTPGYLRSIQADATTDRSPECTDAYYVRYIYRMILDEFTNSNCMNLRIRSIIPDQYVPLVAKHITNLPVFQAYNRLSNADNFTIKVMKRSI